MEESQYQNIYNVFLTSGLLIRVGNFLRRKLPRSCRQLVAMPEISRQLYPSGQVHDPTTMKIGKTGRALQRLEPRLDWRHVVRVPAERACRAFKSSFAHAGIPPVNFHRRAPLGDFVHIDRHMSHSLLVLELREPNWDLTGVEKACCLKVSNSSCSRRFAIHHIWATGNPPTDVSSLSVVQVR